MPNGPEIQLLERAESILVMQLMEDGHDLDICECSGCSWIKDYDLFCGVKR